MTKQADIDAAVVALEQAGWQITGGDDPEIWLTNEAGVELTLTVPDDIDEEEQS